MEQTKKQILHQIRNYLSSIQTFIQVVEVDEGNIPLKKVHKSCAENLAQILELLKKLERMGEDGK